MQALGDGVLTDAQVVDALDAYDRSWTVRYDVLDIANRGIGTLGIGAYSGVHVHSGAVDVNVDRDVKAQLRLSVHEDPGVVVPWEAIRLQPWWELRVGNATRQWALGVFVPWFPPASESETGRSREINAADRSHTLLGAFATAGMINMAATDGAGNAFPAGTNLLAAIRRLLQGWGGFALADILVSDPAVTLAGPKSWPVGQGSVLAAINELLGSVHQRSLWFDPLGRARSDPVPSLATTTPAEIYTDGDGSKVSSPMSVTLDTDRIANVVTVACEDPQRAAFAATVENHDPRSRVAIEVLGYRRPKRVVSNSLHDVAAAQRRALSELEEASQVYERRALTTIADPRFQCFEVVDVLIGDLAARFHQRSWSMVLDPADNRMTHQLSRVATL